MGLRFEWDPAKNAANQRKHGLSFAEVLSLFAPGSDALELYDEERFISIGPARRGSVVVVWTERAQDVIRIISARLATQREAALYRGSR